MHLQSEKVTCTCSQRFAELDPYCPSMLEAACESFRAGAVASRLSLEVLRRLSSRLLTVAPVEADVLHECVDTCEGFARPHIRAVDVMDATIAIAGKVERAGGLALFALVQGQ